MIFGALESMIMVLMLPVRAVGAFAGRGVIWLVTLPFRILGLAARLVGLLLVFGLVVMGVVTLLSLVRLL
jgi:hypothetical protein